MMGYVMLDSLKKKFFKTPCRVSDKERLAPVSRLFGLDRGTPVDRRYIERFLSVNAQDICGVALEIADSAYSRRFGGERVTSFEVLHKDNSVAGCTVQGNLEVENSLPENLADVFICTQTLPFLFDLQQAVRNIHRVLKPDGVVLCTLPGISQISRYDADRWGDFWRFTPQGTERLFTSVFRNVSVDVFGNCLAAKAFLDGIAVEDLPAPEILDVRDADYPVTITVRAVKDAIG